KGGQGRRDQGRGREDQGRPRGGRRQGRDQVGRCGAAQPGRVSGAPLGSSGRRSGLDAGRRSATVAASGPSVRPILHWLESRYPTPSVSAALSLFPTLLG